MSSRRKGQRGLLHVVKGCYPRVEVSTVYDSIARTHAILPRTGPSVLFLSVQLNSSANFSLLNDLPRVPFRIVFIATCSDCTVRTVHFDTLSCLLGPVSPRRLARTMSGTIRIILQGRRGGQVRGLLRGARTLSGRGGVTLSITSGVRFMRVNSVVHYRSRDGCAAFCLGSKRGLVMSGALGRFSRLLTPCRFLHIRRSRLVGLSRVGDFVGDSNKCVHVGSKTSIDVSHRQQGCIVRMLGRLWAGPSGWLLVPCVSGQGNLPWYILPQGYH